MRNQKYNTPNLINPLRKRPEKRNYTRASESYVSKQIPPNFHTRTYFSDDQGNPLLVLRDTIQKTKLPTFYKGELAPIQVGDFFLGPDNRKFKVLEIQHSITNSFNSYNKRFIILEEIS